MINQNWHVQPLDKLLFIILCKEWLKESLLLLFEIVVDSVTEKLIKVMTTKLENSLYNIFLIFYQIPTLLCGINSNILGLSNGYLSQNQLFSWNIITICPEMKFASLFYRIVVYPYPRVLLVCCAKCLSYTLAEEYLFILEKYGNRYTWDPRKNTSV